MASYVYDPSRNAVRIAGHYIVGLTSIVVKRGEDVFKSAEGIDPLYSCRIKQFKRPFELQIRVLQASPSNSFLQHLYTSSEVVKNSFFTVEVLSQAYDGRVRPNIASTGYIQSAPDLTLVQDSSDSEWVFKVNAFDFSGLKDLIV